MRICRWAWPLFSVALLSSAALAAPPPPPGPPPWSAYNEGVRAYAKKDYGQALQSWQDLSGQRLPGSLRLPVWFQMGNAQFRMGEPLESNAPEETAELWRRSCEAYRALLAVKPRDLSARHNLALVERRLARLTHRLGMETFTAAEPKPLDDAIPLLRDSVNYLREATTLAPQDLELRRDRDRVERALRERLRDRARRAETKGDEAAQRVNSWSDRAAESEYRAALEDLAEARRPEAQPQSAERADALDQTVRQAEERVEQKLAQLLTRMGQREQKAGNEQAEYDPDQALSHYETALDDFQQAQEVQPGNEAARRGEREVRAAMEKLQMRQGRAELARGKEALAQQSPRAAPALSSALSHFEAAQELNPANEEARAGAAEARRLLPDALALAGNSEMRAGDRAERQSATEALNRYQEAEKDFREALDLQPTHQPAQQGLREVEPKLARMRERAAKEAEALARQNQPQNRPPPTLQSLLGQVDERERPREVERQRQRGRKDTSQRKDYPDW